MTSAGPTLLGPADVRALAARLDVRPTKQRGQNFVIDANTVRRIVRAAAPGARRRGRRGRAGAGVADAGAARRGAPGRGDRGRPGAGRRAAGDACDVRRGPGRALRGAGRRRAARSTAIPGPPPTALVANLPYNVSVPVLLHLLALLPSLERGLVMVQSEVADRLAAAPGSKVYGVPSVKAAWYADVRRAGAIGRNVFWPAPNVDSGLVAWTRREPPADDGHPGAGVRGRRRGVRPSPQGAARRAARPGRLERGGRRRR